MQEENGIIDNIEDRIVEVLTLLDSVDPGTKEYSDLQKELNTLARLRQTEVDFEKNDLEERKFVFEKGRNIVEEEVREKQFKWETTLKVIGTVGSIVITPAMIIFGIIYDKSEVMPKPVSELFKGLFRKV